MEGKGEGFGWRRVRRLNKRHVKEIKIKNKLKNHKKGVFC